MQLWRVEMYLFLISESPFYLDGEGGLLEYVERRLKDNGHMVIVVAEGAGQELLAAETLKTSTAQDASGNKLQGTRTESGFKRAFATLSGQDIETFTGTMFLNVEQLQKQLDKEDFQKIGSMAAFNILYTQLAILEFRDTLIQHLESVKKSIDKRAQLKREYDSWVNERQMQTTEEKVDTSKALDASSVDTDCSRTKSKEHDTSSRSRNDAHDDGADIKPIYDEEPMAKVQTTAEINVFAIGQQHTEQPEFNNEGEVV
uniref:ATP-dependent 6-phosphofructokinase 6-like n=1 Tax=Tanacetum cinerariifolium TaxID=118510 RepID=A0A6L2MZV3_TANCI|nr:ATP-dependent 6-phosphofructokinase 6-like [Tanacetum cinerariifolium]